jgi:hypothetical protein
MVVAFHQHGVDGGDGALIAGAVAGTLHIGGERAKDRRRVAFGGGWLAHREADFSRRHGETGEAVHHQQHMRALVPEVFRRRRREIRAMQAS